MKDDTDNCIKCESDFAKTCKPISNAKKCMVGAYLKEKEINARILTEGDFTGINCYKPATFMTIKGKFKTLLADCR